MKVEKVATGLGLMWAFSIGMVQPAQAMFERTVRGTIQVVESDSAEEGQLAIAQVRGRFLATYSYTAAENTTPFWRWRDCNAARERAKAQALRMCADAGGQDCVRVKLVKQLYQRIEYMPGAFTSQCDVTAYVVDLQQIENLRQPEYSESEAEQLQY